MTTKCKYCEQLPSKCPCAKVDRLFFENWDLMYNWDFSKQYKFAYAVPKKKTIRLVGTA